MEKQKFDWDKLLSEVPPSRHKQFDVYRQDPSRLNG